MLGCQSTLGLVGTNRPSCTETERTVRSTCIVLCVLHVRDDEDEERPRSCPQVRWNRAGHVFSRASSPKSTVEIYEIVFSCLTSCFGGPCSKVARYQGQPRLTGRVDPLAQRCATVHSFARSSRVIYSPSPFCRASSIGCVRVA